MLTQPKTFTPDENGVLHWVVRNADRLIMIGSVGLEIIHL